MNTKFSDLIAGAAKGSGLPWWLIYGVIEQESDFDPMARSACGAVGLMQLMPSSFPSINADHLGDPATNVRLGTEHLKECIDIWRDEDTDEAIKFGLASYNGGPGYVLAAQRLAAAEGVDPHQWHNVAPKLTVCECNGLKPDAAQMIGYVQSIWTKFSARRNAPVPDGTESV